MVFQDYALYPHMTVYDNLSFGLRNLGVERKVIETKVHEVAELLQIGRLLQRRPRELSGGQRQRVALGRAIVRSPQVFLFDEPLSNLDAKLRVQMRVDLLDLHRRLGNTVIYVTHDQVEAMTLGDRIVVMLDGLIQQIDTPRHIYERPRNTFVASFMGAPPMNLLIGEIDADGVFRGDGLTITIPPTTPARQQAIRSRSVVLGVRPDDIAEAPTEQGDVAGTVRAVEFVGSETLVHLDVGKHFLTARLGPQSDILPGHNLGVRLDFARVSFFDTETQERLN
jgi:multiple sugar transport system ATP-binding protein